MIKILNHTMKDPISFMGLAAGACWNADVSDSERNYKRGLDCIKSDHGRVEEYPDVYFIIEGYSARVLREFMRHVGDGLTCLQESTRYVNESGFTYVTPNMSEDATDIYKAAMRSINSYYNELLAYGVKKEDAAMILPLGMTTKVVYKKNLRNLAEMSHKRLCMRSYWEFRGLMHDIMNELSCYSNEWKTVVDILFKPQCEILNKCPEKQSCGRFFK